MLGTQRARFAHAIKTGCRRHAPAPSVCICVPVETPGSRRGCRGNQTQTQTQPQTQCDREWRTRAL
eukprot:10565159-Lingulodinium_polyedra.AAC.1